MHQIITKEVGTIQQFIVFASMLLILKLYRYPCSHHSHKLRRASSSSVAAAAVTAAPVVSRRWHHILSISRLWLSWLQQQTSSPFEQCQQQQRKEQQQPKRRYAELLPEAWIRFSTDQFLVLIHILKQLWFK